RHGRHPRPAPGADVLAATVQQTLSGSTVAGPAEGSALVIRRFPKKRWSAEGVAFFRRGTMIGQTSARQQTDRTRPVLDPGQRRIAWIALRFVGAAIVVSLIIATIFTRS